MLIPFRRPERWTPSWRPSSLKSPELDVVLVKGARRRHYHIRRARQHDLWTSINYLSFPGVTDDEDEFAALSHLIESTGLQMIQWRNLNIDPDWYVNSINLPATKTLGMPLLLQKVRKKFPEVRFGYFNPPVASNQ